MNAALRAAAVTSRSPSAPPPAAPTAPAREAGSSTMAVQGTASRFAASANGAAVPMW